MSDEITESYYRAAIGEWVAAFTANLSDVDLPLLKEEDWERYFAAVVQTLQRFASMQASGADDPEAVTSEAFFSLWSHPEVWKPQGLSVQELGLTMMRTRGYLKTIVSRAAAREWSQRRQRPFSVDLSDVVDVADSRPTPEDQAVLALPPSQLLGALSTTLSEDDLEFLDDFAASDYSYPAVAAARGTSERAARQKMYRLKEKLRRQGEDATGNASHYRTLLDRNHRQKIDAEKAAAEYQRKAVQLRVNAADARVDASRTKNVTTRARKLRDADQREREAAKAAHEAARWQAKLARYSKEVSALQSKLLRTEQLEEAAARRLANERYELDHFFSES